MPSALWERVFGGSEGGEEAGAPAPGAPEAAGESEEAEPAGTSIDKWPGVVLVSTRRLATAAETRLGSAVGERANSREVGAATAVAVSTTCIVQPNDGRTKDSASSHHFHHRDQCLASCVLSASAVCRKPRMSLAHTRLCAMW